MAIMPVAADVVRTQCRDMARKHVADARVQLEQARAALALLEDWKETLNRDHAFPDDHAMRAELAQLHSMYEEFRATAERIASASVSVDVSPRSSIASEPQDADAVHASKKRKGAPPSAEGPVVAATIPADIEYESAATEHSAEEQFGAYLELIHACGDSMSDTELMEGISALFERCGTQTYPPKKTLQWGLLNADLVSVLEHIDQVDYVPDEPIEPQLLTVLEPLVRWYVAVTKSNRKIDPAKSIHAMRLLAANQHRAPWFAAYATSLEQFHLARDLVSASQTAAYRATVETITAELSALTSKKTLQTASLVSYMNTLREILDTRLFADWEPIKDPSVQRLLDLLLEKMFDIEGAPAKTMEQHFDSVRDWRVRYLSPT